MREMRKVAVGGQPELPRGGRTKGAKNQPVERKWLVKVRLEVNHLNVGDFGRQKKKNRILIAALRGCLRFGGMPRRESKRAEDIKKGPKGWGKKKKCFKSAHTNPTERGHERHCPERRHSSS